MGKAGRERTRKVGPPPEADPGLPPVVPTRRRHPPIRRGLRTTRSTPGNSRHRSRGNRGRPPAAVGRCPNAPIHQLPLRSGLRITRLSREICGHRSQVASVRKAMCRPVTAASASDGRHERWPLKPRASRCSSPLSPSARCCSANGGPALSSRSGACCTGQERPTHGTAVADAGRSKPRRLPRLEFLDRLRETADRPARRVGRVVPTRRNLAREVRSHGFQVGVRSGPAAQLSMGRSFSFQPSNPPSSSMMGKPRAAKSTAAVAAR